MLHPSLVWSFYDTCLRYSHVCVQKASIQGSLSLGALQQYVKYPAKPDYLLLPAPLNCTPLPPVQMNPLYVSARKIDVLSKGQPAPPPPHLKQTYPFNESHPDPVFVELSSPSTMPGFWNHFFAPNNLFPVKLLLNNQRTIWTQPLFWPIQFCLLGFGKVQFAPGLENCSLQIQVHLSSD